jgi:hypothetical protein
MTREISLEWDAERLHNDPKLIQGARSTAARPGDRHRLCKSHIDLGPAWTRSFSNMIRQLLVPALSRELGQ